MAPSRTLYQNPLVHNVEPECGESCGADTPDLHPQTQRSNAADDFRPSTAQGDTREPEAELAPVPPSFSHYSCLIR